jgi:hypothetical protein
MTKIETFNKESECKKQGEIPPESIIYCGKIEDVNDVILKESKLDYQSFFELLKDAKEDEDGCIIYIL